MNRYLYVALLDTGDLRPSFAHTFVEAEDASMAYDDGFDILDREKNIGGRLINDYVVELGPAEYEYDDGFGWDPITQQYYSR